MFELSVIHRPGLVAGKINLGRILETMLYYDRVHLMMSAQMFLGLWNLLGPDDMYVLMSHPIVTSTLTSEILGIQNDIGPLVITHKPVAIKVAGREGRVISDKDDVGSLVQMLSGASNRPGGTRAHVNRLVKLAKTSRYAKMLGGNAPSQERFLSLVRDQDTLKLFLRGWAAARREQVNEKRLALNTIETVEFGERVMFASDAPLESIISGWNARESWGEVLANVQNYAVDLYLSNAYSADIVTEPAVAEVAAARLDLSLQRANVAADGISSFEELVFEEAHSFADSINDGVITFKEALKIIDQSRRFRTWIKGLAPDADLIAEYYRAVTRETLLKTLPASIARFAIFNGAGMVADAIVPRTGLIASAMDTFVVERILGGWRPNIFIANMKKTLAKARDRAAGTI